MDEKINIRALQGLTVPGLEVRIVNEDGEVPWDGKTMGELAVEVLGLQVNIIKTNGRGSI